MSDGFWFKVPAIRCSGDGGEMVKAIFSLKQDYTGGFDWQYIRWHGPIIKPIDRKLPKKIKKTSGQ